MAMTKEMIQAQEARRHDIAIFTVQGMSKGQMALELQVSTQTITRDCKWLVDKWNKELVKDPVEHRGRILATMMHLRDEAAANYKVTKNMGWWDRWMHSTQSIATFLGLDAPIKIDATVDGDVHFTFEFDTPDDRIIDVDRANYDVSDMEEDDDGG